jgi:hypothetical protein
VSTLLKLFFLYFSIILRALVLKNVVKIKHYLRSKAIKKYLNGISDININHQILHVNIRWLASCN